jgi:hypothetical protein
MTKLERQAQREGLSFIDELVFENGAVYKGKKLPSTDLYSTRLPEGRDAARAWYPGVA